MDQNKNDKFKELELVAEEMIDIQSYTSIAGATLSSIGCASTAMSVTSSISSVGCATTFFPSA